MRCEVRCGYDGARAYWQTDRRIQTVGGLDKEQFAEPCFCRLAAVPHGVWMFGLDIQLSCSGFCMGTNLPIVAGLAASSKIFSADQSWFGGKWFNAIDERGLPAHCVADHWNDWNGSYSTHTKA